MKRLKIFAGGALISIAAVVGIGAGQSTQAAPRWNLHGYVTARVGASSFGASVIDTQTTADPRNLRVRNVGTAAIYLDFTTTCYQYQRGQDYPYAVAKSLFNVPIRARTGAINVWPGYPAGSVRPYKYCTVRAAGRPQRARPGVVTMRVEGY